MPISRVLRKATSKVSKTKKPSLINELVSLPTRRFYLAHNTAFTKQYGKLFRPVYWVIRKNYSKLSLLPKGKKFFDPKTKVTLERTRTGKYAGGNTYLGLKVDFNGKSVFVKIGNTDPDRCFLAAKTAQSFLKRNGNKVGEFNVQVIAPNLMYADESAVRPFKPNELQSEHSFIVSDFFPSRNGYLLIDFQKKIGPKKWGEFDRSPLGKALIQLRSELEEVGVMDAGLHNAFFNPKTKTIYLFDLALEG